MCGCQKETSDLPRFDPQGDVQYNFAGLIGRINGLEGRIAAHNAGVAALEARLRAMERGSTLAAAPMRSSTASLGVYPPWPDLAGPSRPEPESAIDDGTRPEQPITESIIDELRDRSAKGLAKYGKTIDRDDLSTSDWLQHLKEELLDAVQYIEAARRRAASPEHRLGAVLVEYDVIPFPDAMVERRVARLAPGATVVMPPGSRVVSIRSK
ncbi:MAG: hypothetical protein ACRC2H_01045 [Silanimonas sp.]